MTRALQQTGEADLRALAGSLREGPLSAGVSRHLVTQLVGPRGGEVADEILALCAEGWTPAQVSVLANAIADSRAAAGDPSSVFDLVLSGPDVPGVPTSDTAAVVRSLIEEAAEEILLVGYAVHNGRLLFEPLARRMQANPALRVRLCLDIPRKLTDTSLSSEIVRRFLRDFRGRHWPWPEMPEIYHDPRALAATTEERASLHAKCIVIDRRAALVTSANFTRAAQEKNIEAGILIRHPAFAARLVAYFEGLIAKGGLAQCQSK